MNTWFYSQKQTLTILNQSINNRINQIFDEFNKHSGKVYNLSCSIGYVEYDATTPPDLNLLLRLADEAMYRCKQNL